MASNGGCSPYSGFPIYPRASATASNSSCSQGMNNSPLTSSLNYLPTLQFPALHCTVLTLTNCPAYNTLARPHRKHRSSVAVQLLLSGLHRKHLSSVAVQLLLSGLHRKHCSSISLWVHVRNLLLSSGRCLQSRYLATGLHATILYIPLGACAHICTTKVIKEWGEREEEEEEESKKKYKEAEEGIINNAEEMRNKRKSEGEIDMRRRWMKD
jgi:hypothetical protein